MHVYVCMFTRPVTLFVDFLLLFRAPGVECIGLAKVQIKMLHDLDEEGTGDDLYSYIYMCVCACVCVHIYIYIYIYLYM